MTPEPIWSIDQWKSSLPAQLLRESLFITGTMEIDDLERYQRACGMLYISMRGLPYVVTSLS